MNRRAFLSGLGATLAGCLPKASLLPGTPQRLGWRLGLGQVFDQTTTIRRTDGVRALEQQVRWRYQVRELLPSGQYLLQATPLAVGIASSRAADATASLERALDDRHQQAATFRLDLDGRVLDAPGEDFSARIPHLLLGMKLPSTPVLPGASWTDPALAALLAPVFPTHMSLTTDATTTWQTGRQIVELHHEARASLPEGGPALLATGRSEWDTNEGRLRKRHLHLELVPSDGSHPGTLELLLEG